MASISPVSHTYTIDEVRDQVVQRIRALDATSEQNSYMRWLQDNRNRIKGDLITNNKNSGIGDIAQEADIQWKALSDEERMPYQTDPPDDLVEVFPRTTEALVDVCKRRIDDGSAFVMASSEVLVAINTNDADSEDDAFSPAAMSRHMPSALVPCEEPHVFGSAIRVWRRAWGGESPAPQVMLVAGESASGKSEMFKQIWRCMAQLKDPQTAVGPAPSDAATMAVDKAVEDALLLVSCFGNVPTKLNGDSSRCAKALTLQFTRGKGALVGCSLRVPVKSLVDGIGTVSHENPGYSLWFRVFHHMLLGSSPQQRELYALDNEWAAASFRIAVQSSAYSSFGPEEHSAVFSELHESMRRLNPVIETSMHEALFRFMAGLLHLAHLGLGGDESVKVEEPRALPVLSELLGIAPERLEEAMCTKRKEFGQQIEVLALSRDEAVALQRSLVRTLYGHVFDFVVESVDASLKTRFGVVNEAQQSTIGSVTLLDGFGAETETRTNLDKFCRNYATEKLHKVFVQANFLNQMNEIFNEGINGAVLESAKISADNADLLDALESSPSGLLAILADQSATPRPSASGLISDLAKRLKSKRVTKLSPKQGNESFVVVHTSGSVTYLISDFFDDNKVAVNEGLVNLMSESTNPAAAMLVKKYLVKSQDSKGGAGSGRRKKKEAVVLRNFTKAAAELAGECDSAEVFTVKCIRASHSGKSLEVDDQLLAEQLESQGVMDVCDFRGRTGFALEADYLTFERKYVYGEPVNLSSDTTKYLKENDEVEVLCKAEIRVKESKWRTGRVSKVPEHMDGSFEIEYDDLRADIEAGGERSLLAQKLKNGRIARHSNIRKRLRAGDRVEVLCEPEEDDQEKTWHAGKILTDPDAEDGLFEVEYDDCLRAEIPVGEEEKSEQRKSRIARRETMRRETRKFYLRRPPLNLRGNLDLPNSPAGIDAHCATTFLNTIWSMFMTGPNITGINGNLQTYCCFGRSKLFARRMLTVVLDTIIQLGLSEENSSARAIQTRHRRNRIRGIFLHKRSSASMFAWVVRTVIARQRFLRTRRSIIVLQSYILMAPVRFGYLALRACAIRIQRWWPWRSLQRFMRRKMVARRAERTIFDRVIAWRQGEACRDPSGEHAIAIRKVIAMRARRDAENKAVACLQLYARLFLFRLGYLKLRNAALRLQPVSRAYVVRRHLSKFYITMPRFQRRALSFLAQRRLRALRNAAMRLQHFARNHPAVWKKRRQACVTAAIKFQSVVRILLARSRLKKVSTLAEEKSRIDSCADALLLEVQDLQRNINAAQSQFPLIDVDVTESSGMMDDNETWVHQVIRAVDLLPASDALSEVAMSGPFTLLLSASGRLCSIGKKPVLVKEGPNSRWQLPLKSRIAQLSCGNAHAAMLTERGNVLTCGSGQRGQLGRGSFETMSLVVDVPSLENPVGFRQVSCASFGTVALTNDGSVYTWGMGEVLGRGVYLGDGDSATPMAVNSLTPFRIREIACGNNFVVALAYQGAIYGWGANDFGEMGPEAQLGRPKYMPAQIQDVLLTPTDPVKSVCCGLKHVAVLTSGGNVLCWGRSDVGQIGTEPNSGIGINAVSFPVKSQTAPQPRISNIACGGRQTYAISKDGAVYAWGIVNACKPGTSGTIVSSVTPAPIQIPDSCLGMRRRSIPDGRRQGPLQHLSASWSCKGSAVFFGLASPRSRKQNNEDPHVAQLSEATAIDPDVCSMLLLSRKPKAETIIPPDIPESNQRSRSTRLQRSSGSSVGRRTESEILAERVVSFQALHALKDEQMRAKSEQRKEKRLRLEGKPRVDFPVRFFQSGKIDSRAEKEHRVHFKVEEAEENHSPHLSEKAVLAKILLLRAELTKAKEQYQSISRGVGGE
jgi:alpha-tubulin suppressor-like RCC1 family protein